MIDICGTVHGIRNVKEVASQTCIIIPIADRPLPQTPSISNFVGRDRKIFQTLY